MCQLFCTVLSISYLYFFPPDILLLVKVSIVIYTLFHSILYILEFWLCLSVSVSSITSTFQRSHTIFPISASPYTYTLHLLFEISINSLPAVFTKYASVIKGNGTENNVQFLL